LKKEIEELLLAEKNFKSGIYNENKTLEVNKIILTKLIDQKKLISNKTKEIDLSKKALNDSISLQENLGYLVELGKKIINNNKQSSCPLCKNEYEDYKELLERINSNNSLQDSSKEKTEILAHLESELTSLVKEHEKEATSLKTIISEKIKEFQLKLNESANKSETLSREISLLEKDLEKHKIIVEKHEKENQKTDLENIASSVNMFSTKVKSYETIIEKYTFWVDRINKKKSNINREIYDLDKQSEAIKHTNIYTDFNKILNLYNLNSNDPGLDNRLNKLKKEFEDFKKELSILNREINLLEESLKEYKREELKEQLSIYQTDLLRINSFISEFNDLILNFNTKREELESSLKSKIDINEAEISKNEKILRVLSKIEGMTESLDEYLNYNKLKQKETDIKLKIELNKRIDDDLQENLQSISKKISSMIKKFFFDDLINTIYNKIDPHPQYKKINFKVDFDDYGSPKLNIFTEDNEKSGNRVPNLYFSTAQMNVLSLSIFLAKALHAVDEKENSIDTIFIDDPVQSMDSINVLSVIDLLRNIIINHNKQIIISTHDENFFNLLKKKIPSSYFKSKFLELETFGKLKKENNYMSLTKGIMDSARNIIKKNMNDNDGMLMA
jgi:exonuclease SbcC